MIKGGNWIILQNSAVYLCFYKTINSCYNMHYNYIYVINTQFIALEKTFLFFYSFLTLLFVEHYRQ